MAAADKKEKEFPTRKEGKIVFTETVTYRYWSEQDKRFNNPIKNVNAVRWTSPDGDKQFALRAPDTNGKPPLKSEIEDADGFVYVITKVAKGDTENICYVARKP